MRPIGSATSSALSGLNAADTRLRVSAHNTANSLTSGFVPTEVSESDDPAGGVKVSISAGARDAAARPSSVGGGASLSGTDLVAETRSNILGAAAFRANLKTLQTADELSQTLMETVSSTSRRA